MEVEEFTNGTLDDGFSEFVNDRTGKLREIPEIHKVTSLKEKVENLKSIDDEKDNLLSTSFSEMHRSDGSGSENGTEKFNDTNSWYINEKQLSDKHSSRIEATQVYSPVNYANTNCKNWRTAHMESFESNKELLGSDCGSRLSLFSQSKDDYNEEEEDWDERPTGERWPPLGAPNDDEDDRSICSFEELGRSRSEVSRLKELEEEQEQLNCSLMSLTSHFAQVQFRLKQITLADPEEKERLLKELEDFADRGIPDFRAIQHTRDAAEKSTCDSFTEQKELIERLKEQLDELEQYAYSAGEAGMPQTVLMNKQKVVIDQLKGKLPLNLDDLDRLSAEDLRTQVDVCIRELINPLKMKEQLVSQLQTQIGDLERFIDFLQDDGQKNLPEGALSPSKCKCGGHSPSNKSNFSKSKSSKKRPGLQHSASTEKQLREDTANLVDRAALLLNMLKFAQLGCGSAPSTSDEFKQNASSNSNKGNHYGDVRANLEVAVSTLVEYLSVASSTGTSSDSEVTSSAVTLASHVTPQHVTLCVRKQFVPALRDLLHHGLVSSNSSRSLVSAWSCFPDRSARVGGSKMLHAWDLVLEYYHLKKGDHYNTTPARRLSQSFNLQLSNNTPEGGVGHKGALLVAVGNILSSHTPLKRSPDSHFKAFVSEGLNQRRLVVWLRLILRCHPLIEKYYQPWSYVMMTGFDDALKSLEGLQIYNFNLPVDLAVRSLRDIADAF